MIVTNSTCVNNTAKQVTDRCALYCTLCLQPSSAVQYAQRDVVLALNPVADMSKTSQLTVSVHKVH